MFDLVHKNKRIIQIFLGLIALTFATWGIESYTRMQGGRDTVATVNGLEILGARVRRRAAPALRPAPPGARRQLRSVAVRHPRDGLLDSLVSQRLIASAAYGARLTVTDEVLVDSIHSIPAFKGADGNFSKETYESVLRQQTPPMTPAQFESRLRYELALTQLARAVGESAIPSRTVSGRLAALEAQQREIEFRILAEPFLPQVKIDDAKVKAYYDANQAQFQTPERVKAEYVVLSGEAIAAQEDVKPEEVRSHWESAYGPKMREKEEARKKAEAIAASVRKNPASFAEVAKKESQIRQQGGRRRPRLRPARQLRQALRGRALPHEGRPGLGGGGERVRLPHHPAHRRAQAGRQGGAALEPHPGSRARRCQAVRGDARTGRGRAQEDTRAAPLQRDRGFVPEHGVRAARQPEARGRTLQAEDRDERLDDARG